MSKLITDELNYMQIANAIRDKSFGSSTYLPSEMAAAIRGLGEIENGTIQQVTAGSAAIPANTFVQMDPAWYTGYYSTVDKTTVSSATAYSGLSYPKIIKLSDSKSLVAYHSGDSSSSLSVRFRICSMSGTTITPGSEVSQAGMVIPNGGGAYWDVVKINDLTSIAIYSTSYNGDVNCFTIDTSGNTPQLGSTVTISQGTSVFYASCAAKIDNSHVAVVYRNSNKVYIKILTVSGASVTVSSETQLLTSTEGAERGGTCLIPLSSTHLAFVGGGHNSNDRWAQSIVDMTISGTTVTVNGFSYITNASSGYNGSTGCTNYCVISETRALVAWPMSTNAYVYLYDFSQNTASQISNLSFSASGANSDYRMNIMRISDTEFCVRCGGPSNSGQSLRKISYDETAGTISSVTYTYITALDSTSAYCGETIQLDDDGFMSVYSGSNQLVMGYLYREPRYAVASTDRIDGVTAEPIAASGTGDVWVLNQGS